MSVEIFDVSHDSQSVISVTEAAAAHLLKQVQLKWHVGGAAQRQREWLHRLHVRHGRGQCAAER